MVQGKARLARTRALSQSWFDGELIDEFVHGEPRDPLADREVRIVYGASRLAECVLDRVAAESERVDDDDSRVWDAPRFEIVELPALRRPMPPSVVEPDSVLVPFELTLPAPIRLETRQTVAEADSPAVQPSTDRPARLTNSIQLTPRMHRCEADDRFDWVRFFGGVCAGGLAAAIVIAVVVGG